MQKFVVLFDLSAAFDTIDHAILLDGLQRRHSFAGVALRWLESYLRDRKQSVIIGQASSSETTLITGVPQGSVLRPLLFSLYVQPIGDIIHNHD